MNAPAAGQNLVIVGASGMVGGYALRYALVRCEPILLFEFAHQFQRRPRVPPSLDQNTEHVTLGIHGTP